MMTARKLKLPPFFRLDVFKLTMRIRGYNLTGATLKFAISQYRDETGSPLIGLTNTVTPGASGVRIVATGVTDDVPWTDLEILSGKPSLKDDLPPPPEVGPGSDADAIYAWDFKWVRPADDSGFTSVEETVLYGDLTVKGSAND